MLIIQSEYSPAAARELHEADNINAIYAALIMAGMDCFSLKSYQRYNEMANAAFNAALEEYEPNELGHYSETAYLHAQGAQQSHMDAAMNILVKAGITIKNELHRQPIPEGETESPLFDEVKTLVCGDAEEMTPYAVIVRPLLDNESEVYQDNWVGWGKHNADLLSEPQDQEGKDESVDPEKAS